MITEKSYLEAKKIVETYESEQLNISDVSGSNQRLCICSTDCLGCYHKDVKCKKLRGYYR
jgi:hypothetical protein